MAIYIQQLLDSLKKGNIEHCFGVNENDLDLIKKKLDKMQIDYEIKPEEKNYKLFIVGSKK